MVASLPPQVVDDSYQASTQTTLTVTELGVLANDTPAVTGATLSATLIQTVAHGSLTLHADGSFVYAAVSGFVGVDSFTYRASAIDSTPSREVTVTIDVIAPPVVSADQPAIMVDSGTTAGNTGAFSSAGSLVTIVASVGTITQFPGATGLWSWSLDTGAATPDQTVIITATDDLGGTSTTSFQQVMSNHQPTADAGPDQTRSEGILVTLNGVFTDPESADTHTQSWNVLASTGQVIFACSGPSCDFTPNDNGTYTVVYTVIDDDGGVGSDVVVVTVSNVAPTAIFADNGPITYGRTATVAFSNQHDDSIADTSAGFHYAYSLIA